MGGANDQNADSFNGFQWNSSNPTGAMFILNATAVPEPGTIILTTTSLLGVFGFSFLRRKKM